MPEAYPVLNTDMGVGERVAKEFPDYVRGVRQFRGAEVIDIKPDGVKDIVQYLRDTPELDFNFLVELCGVDYLGIAEPRFCVVYILRSHARNAQVELHAWIPEEDPKIDSLVPLFPAANWLEREIWDLFGIEFVSHPNLTKILTPDDLPGHPLRKDFDIQFEEVAFDFNMEERIAEGEYLRPDKWQDTGPTERDWEKPT